jgi:hypothetical protein
MGPAGSQGVALGCPARPRWGEYMNSQIAATDRQIDQLVYELYGLSDEEIKIVEGEAA